MILSIAHAPVDDATKEHLLGAWSDLIVGERPPGLVDCYLVEGDGLIQIAAVWSSIQHHDRALTDEESHPAFVVFEASGLDPSHTVYRVIGHLPGHGT